MATYKNRTNHRNRKVCNKEKQIAKGINKLIITDHAEELSKLNKQVRDCVINEIDLFDHTSSNFYILSKCIYTYIPNEVAIRKPSEKHV
jgi:hypothetical protein